MQMTLAVTFWLIILLSITATISTFM